MNFKTNFNKISLLGKVPIKIYFDNKIVEFVPPNLRMYYTDLDFLEFLFILKLELKEANKYFKMENFIAENKYEILLAILKIGYKKNEILKYLSFIFPNVIYKNSRLEVEENILTFEEYDTLLEFLLVTCLEKDFKAFMAKISQEENIKEEVLTPLQLKLKEQEEKLAKAKNKKKQDTSSNKNSITIDQIVIAILYEFPNFSLEDIYNMDLITFFDFWNYVAKVVDNKIQTIAAGNGLIKKFTYFIN